MEDRELPRKDRSRGHQAERLLAEMFGEAGWQVRLQPKGPEGLRPDLLVRRGASSYVIEVKAAPEGRSDRLVPLWSLAYLQALRAAGERHQPLAVVAAPQIAPRAAAKVLEFAQEYAPDAAVGVIDFEGLRLFRGPRLDNLNSAAPRISPSRPSRKPADLFSDLNQWMMKVLLAVEIPDRLLSAPRGDFRNVSELARAAEVSVMSAFRFVQLLRDEGFLRESEASLELVRREELFRRWQSWSASRPVHEIPARFLIRGDSKKELNRLFVRERACLALFAAAAALHFGFVHGVPPHVYVDRFPAGRLPKWKNIVPVEAGEEPDLIVRAAPAVESVFRGMVRIEENRVSDILQVWLDVSAHPSRGQEQADLIRRRFLGRIIGGDRPGE